MQIIWNYYYVLGAKMDKIVFIKEKIIKEFKIVSVYLDHPPGTIELGYFCYPKTEADYLELLLCYKIFQDGYTPLFMGIYVPGNHNYY